MQSLHPPSLDHPKPMRLRELAAEHGVTLLLDLLHTSAHGSGLGRRTPAAAASPPPPPPAAPADPHHASGGGEENEEREEAPPQLLISVPMHLCLSDSIPGCSPAASKVARAVPAHLPWEVRLGALLMWATAPSAAGGSEDPSGGGSSEGSTEDVRDLREFWCR